MWKFGCFRDPPVSRAQDWSFLDRFSITSRTHTCQINRLLWVRDTRSNLTGPAGARVRGPASVLEEEPRAAETRKSLAMSFAFDPLCVENRVGV